MLIAIPDLLTPAELARVRALVDAGEWVDGNATSGHQSALAKRNRQLPEDSPAAREAGSLVLDALGRRHEHAKPAVARLDRQCGANRRARCLCDRRDRCRR